MNKEQKRAKQKKERDDKHAEAAKKREERRQEAFVPPEEKQAPKASTSSDVDIAALKDKIKKAQKGKFAFKKKE